MCDLFTAASAFWSIHPLMMRRRHESMFLSMFCSHAVTTLVRSSLIKFSAALGRKNASWKYILINALRLSINENKQGTMAVKLRTLVVLFIFSANANLGSFHQGPWLDKKACSYEQLSQSTREKMTRSIESQHVFQPTQLEEHHRYRKEKVSYRWQDTTLAGSVLTLNYSEILIIIISGKPLFESLKSSLRSVPNSKHRSIVFTVVGKKGSEPESSNKLSRCSLMRSKMNLANIFMHAENMQIFWQLSHLKQGPDYPLLSGLKCPRFTK